jgi:hypothetical protein
LDLEGIYAGEQWWPRVCAAIENADAFLFVISPDSVKSSPCRREMEHAAANKKRILPIVLRPVPDRSVPPQIGECQWIFHDPENPNMGTVLSIWVSGSLTDFAEIDLCPNFAGREVFATSELTGGL